MLSPTLFLDQELIVAPTNRAFWCVGVAICYVSLCSAQACAKDPAPQLLFTSQGRTARINVDGTSLSFFDFSVPNQATWQPGPVFPDGRRLVFLSMEPRRDGPGKSFDEFYTQTPTHIWVHDLAAGDLKEICTKNRLAAFVTPALLLDHDRMLIQYVMTGFDAKPGVSLFACAQQLIEFLLCFGQFKKCRA